MEYNEKLDKMIHKYKLELREGHICSPFFITKTGIPSAHHKYIAANKNAIINLLNMKNKKE